jgi:inner membrane protein
MSPITHGMIGWIISQPLEKRKDRILVTASALLPDFDGAGAIISIDYYSKYHHIFGHNVFFGLILVLISLKYGVHKFKTAVLVFVSFNSHILGDLLGSGAGWGIPYFWPLDNTWYEFSGNLQWELDGWQNVVATMICLILIIVSGLSKQRTIVEVISVSADKKVVAIFNNWFRR